MGFTGPDDVQWTEAAEPAADGGVVIDAVAAGVSFADLHRKQRPTGGVCPECRGPEVR